MATKSGNGRLVVVAAIAAFIAGCWTGMGTDDGGDAYCVVNVASAPQRPGFAPGQLVARDADGCLDGEARVCGTLETSGEPDSFVSDQCKDD
jgi:hypothetical protein